mmetsp:Transcript_32619/g.37360  ORF Transcript_32619/g.37360 Transcript_32619/m.37360 type:complete len:235 (-) Transcript_32619:959-1663(-)
MINTARNIGSLSTRLSQKIMTPIVRGNVTCCSKYHTSRTRVLFPSSLRRAKMTTSSKSKPPKQPHLSVAAAAKTSSGSGKAPNATQIPYIKDRGPVSWPSLFLVGIAAASIVAYYNIERERRLESAMGRVVSSESDGWTPNPDSMAPRKFKLTPWGWFPEDDGFGPCKRERDDDDDDDEFFFCVIERDMLFPVFFFCIDCCICISVLFCFSLQYYKVLFFSIVTLTHFLQIYTL